MDAQAARRLTIRFGPFTLRPAMVLLALLAVAACDNAPPPAAPAAAPPAVTVTPVVRRDIIESDEFVGRIQAIDSVDLRARVQGFLTQRAFTEGSHVNVNDLLFVIDPAPFQAAVDLAQANLASAEAAVPEKDRALERARQLYSRGNVSQATLDQATAEAQQARAAVQARQADLRQAEINLGYTRIISPIAGRIGRAALSIGNLIGPESGVLANVTSVDPIYVNFNISERDLVTFRQDLIARGAQPDLTQIVLRLRLPNGTDYHHDGQINFIGTSVDTSTGTVLIRGSFNNPDLLLQPGQYVTVLVSERRPASALVVPQPAIQEDQAGKFVLTVDASNHVQIRRVTTGPQHDTDWVIESGLSEGDMVIVQGVQRVRPGIVVAPVATARTTGAAGTPGTPGTTGAAGTPGTPGTTGAAGTTGTGG